MMTEYARNDTKEVPQVHNILYITWNEPSFPTILQKLRTSAYINSTTLVSRIISILPI